MSEQSRETLPVELTVPQRRKKIHEEILQSITNNLDNPVGLSEENENELLVHQKIALRHLGEIAAGMTYRPHTTQIII